MLEVEGPQGFRGLLCEALTDAPCFVFQAKMDCSNVEKLLSLALWFKTISCMAHLAYLSLCAKQCHLNNAG